MIQTKVHVAGQRDSLRKIALKYHINLEEFIKVNPHITHPDSNIVGSIINVPPYTSHTVNPLPVPFCPLPEPLESLDHWVPLTPLEEMAKTEYDVLIVGTGAGGGGVLWRLCQQWGRNGKKIGIIDAGDLLIPTHADNIPTLAGRSWSYFLNPKISFPLGNMLPEYSGAKQVFALGGRTLFWAGVTPRIYNEEFANWPISAREMDYYYDIAEQVMDITRTPTPLSQILLNKLRAGGFPEATDTPLAARHTISLSQIRASLFFSSLDLIGQAFNQRSFDLAVRARAVKVFTEKSKAAGIQVMNWEKKSFEIHARTVVLAGSAFETPRLLLNSGVNGRAIGHYLINHSHVGSTAVVPPEVLSSTLSFDVARMRLFVPQTKNQPFQIQINDTIRDEKSLISLGGFGKVEAQYENRMTLDPHNRDEWGVPLFQVYFSYSRKDIAIIEQMMEATKNAASAMGLMDYQSENCMWVPGRDYHEAGTCRIGIDPETSAADKNGQIHGISGLYVADNSMLPSMGAANPTLTTVALSIRTADHIIRQLQ